MKHKHTPGPWACIENTIGTINCEIATAWYPANSAYQYYERQANARLISAAPDLLFCLQEIVKIYGKRDLDDYLYDQERQSDEIRNAMLVIEKATGEKL